MSKRIRKKIERAVRILEDRFGIPKWKIKDPLDELMVTLLSQNTNDNNRDLAYLQLRRRFPTWQDVLDADVSEIYDRIRPAGLANQKAVRMKAILGWVQKRFGGFNLDGVESMSDDQVIELLSSQKGIGIKTIAVLLAFSLNRDICPVDTHVHRISKRLGWTEQKSSAEDSFHLLRDAIPKSRAPTFHLNLLKFGRTICKARSPSCGNCPLWDDCIWDQKLPKATERSPS